MSITAENDSPTEATTRQRLIPAGLKTLVATALTLPAFALNARFSAAWGTRQFSIDKLLAMGLKNSKSRIGAAKPYQFKQGF